MKRTVLVIAAAVVLAGMCGCSSEMAKTGFLSDYSKLKAESDSSYRYFNKPLAGKYTSLIIDPVGFHFKQGAEAIKYKSEGKLTEQNIKDLANYFTSALTTAVIESGFKVAYQPGPGVARLRVAITDIQETGALNVLPQASLLGVGVGGAAMEAEVVDSQTKAQIAAVVESQKGSRVPFSNLGEWGTAKGIMDGWAKRLKLRLDETKGK
jgi:hypothetical protein